MLISYTEVIDTFIKARFLPNSAEARLLPEAYVFDENQSVKWNKEQVQQHNKQKREKDQELREAKVKAMQEAINLAGKYLAQEYNISEKVGVKVFNFARTAREGYYNAEDILDYAEELCNLFKEDK